MGRWFMRAGPKIEILATCGGCEFLQKYPGDYDDFECYCKHPNVVEMDYKGQSEKHKKLPNGVHY